MKTTIDIHSEELHALMKFTKARTKREAIVGLVPTTIAGTGWPRSRGTAAPAGT